MAYQFRTFLVIFGLFALLALTSLLIVQKTLLTNYTTASQDITLTSENELTEALRGKIYDRHGTELVRNEVIFQLEIIPGYIPTAPADAAAYYQRLSNLTNLPLNDVRSALETNIAEADPFRPVILLPDITLQHAIEIRSLMGEERSVTVPSRYRRIYTVIDEGLSHVVGYVGRRDSVEESTPRVESYPSRSITGLSGMELEADRLLRGLPGVQTYLQDLAGRKYSIRETAPAVRGDDVFLTIDLDLQTHAMDALKKYIDLGIADAREDREGRGEYQKEGAFVVLNVENGEILALGSLPEYDPNLLARGENYMAIDALFTDPTTPLISRAVTSLEPPGSTFKPLVALAALEEGFATVDTQIYSAGELPIPNTYDLQGQPVIFKDWLPHGELNMSRALIRSSDIYFYVLAGGWPPASEPLGDDVRALGPELIEAWARKFGFGRTSGLQDRNESQGFVPSVEWKEEQIGESWTLGDTYQFGIGQGNLLATPLQLAVYTAALANGGTIITPSLILDEQRGTSDISLGLDSTNLEFIQNAMVRTAGDVDGTARRAKPDNYSVGAKTGTAEFGVAYSDGGYDEHGYVIAFGPVPNPEIAIAVYIKHGNGAYHASPVAKEIFEAYFSVAAEH
jgi:penicillin-binding protein 2